MTYLSEVLEDTSDGRRPLATSVTLAGTSHETSAVIHQTGQEVGQDILPGQSHQPQFLHVVGSSSDPEDTVKLHRYYYPPVYESLLRV